MCAQNNKNKLAAKRHEIIPSLIRFDDICAHKRGITFNCSLTPISVEVCCVVATAHLRHHQAASFDFHVEFPVLRVFVKLKTLIKT